MRSETDPFDLSEVLELFSQDDPRILQGAKRGILQAMSDGLGLMLEGMRSRLAEDPKRSETLQDLAEAWSAGDPSGVASARFLEHFHALPEQLQQAIRSERDDRVQAALASALEAFKLWARAERLIDETCEAADRLKKHVSNFEEMSESEVEALGEGDRQIAEVARALCAGMRLIERLPDLPAETLACVLDARLLGIGESAARQFRWPDAATEKRRQEAQEAEQRVREAYEKCKAPERDKAGLIARSLKMPRRLVDRHLRKIRGPRRNGSSEATD